MFRRNDQGRAGDLTAERIYGEDAFTSLPERVPSGDSRCLLFGLMGPLCLSGPMEYPRLNALTLQDIIEEAMELPEESRDAVLQIIRELVMKAGVKKEIARRANEAAKSS